MWLYIQMSLTKENFLHYFSPGPGYTCELEADCWHVYQRKFLLSPIFWTMSFLAGNGSFMTEFVLHELTDFSRAPAESLLPASTWSQLWETFFFIFLIGLTPHLHTSFYNFLFSISFIDFCYPSSASSPNILINFFVEKNVISYIGYMAQTFFISFLSYLNATCCLQWTYDSYLLMNYFLFWIKQ